MTREEAIKNINALNAVCGQKNFYDEEFQEALRMAIKALEQEPTTKNDLGADREDAVERLNALKQFIGYDKDSEIVKATQKSLDMAIQALEQEPNTWSLDDAREDFMHDVYNTLDFLPTNEEANQIIDSFDRVTSSIKQEPRWIPISERLPEKFGTYLVTVKEGYMALGVWIGELEYWANVVAWMQSPEPYKEVKE